MGIVYEYMSSNSSSTSTSSQAQTIDNEKLQQFMGKILSDFGGAASAVLVYIGDKLGLYKAMSDFGKPITSQELANLTSTSERYIREWLANQAAGGYLTYDSSTQIGGFQVNMSFYRDEPKILEVFKTGKGIAWGEHDKDLFEGTGKFATLIYTANLVSSWIPALENGKVEQRLKQEGGLKVADIGCGYGTSTILTAKAYPNCKFYGFDNHGASIEYARNKVREEGLGEDRIRFEVASSTNYPAPADAESGYDLIAFFDCLHDMEDPQGATAHALQTLKKPDGTVMIVDPFANDKIEDNLTPIGRMLYAASTMICIPASLSQNGPALGAQAGEAGISKVVKAGGFKRFKRATHTI
jgi:SAM-dependent methyltransferase